MEKCLLFVTTHGDGSDRLWLIRSQLPTSLARRLLTYAAKDVRDDAYVLGEASFVLFCHADDTTPLVTGIAEFVDPAVFTKDKNGEYWCLLASRDDALALYNEYTRDPRYADGPTNESIPKNTYFKNRVDLFRTCIDREWPIPRGPVKARARKGTKRR